MLACAPAGCCASYSAQALKAHQVRRFDLDVRVRDRELHALVLADRPVEHDRARSRIAPRAR
jgi:hypothetical protein